MSTWGRQILDNDANTKAARQMFDKKIPELWALKKLSDNKAVAKYGVIKRSLASVGLDLDGIGQRSH